MKKKHIVGLILDPVFGHKIIDLALRFHCWIVESENNLKYKEEIWRQIDADSDSLESGITTFKRSSTDLETECITILEAIMDHHNEYQHTPGISVIEVYGINLSPRIEKEMREFGFNEFKDNSEGFKAEIKGE